MSITLTTGGCYCGAIRYEATGLPNDVTHCHCVDCRRSSGAAMVTWASFPRDCVRFIHGQREEFVRDGRRRGFCARCGTSLTFLLNAEADAVDVTVSSFDQPEAVTPTAHTWAEDRLPWIRLADGLPAHARGSPKPMA